MEKYSKELINRYINGEDIEDYSIEELENDASFMLGVIKTSNDKNFYKLCSDEVKRDYNIVKYIIMIYRNDLDFIVDVADYFLDNVADSLERAEIAIIMLNISLLNDKEIAAKYKVITDATFAVKRFEVEMSKAKQNDEDYSNEVGMGFIYMFDLYNTSEIVTNYFARKTIDSIFSEYDIDLEPLLHSKYKTADEIKTQGINNFMINFIRMYDEMLSTYVSTHIELLSDFSDRILTIISNWDNYNNQNERRRYNTMFEQVHEYMGSVDSIIPEFDLIYYIAREIGITDKVRQYDRLPGSIMDEYMDEIDLESLTEIEEDFIHVTLNSSLDEKRHYMNVKNIMMNALFGIQISKPTSSSKDHKGDILKLDFRRKDEDK